jgi:hypothetical protein
MVRFCKCNKLLGAVGDWIRNHRLNKPIPGTLYIWLAIVQPTESLTQGLFRSDDEGKDLRGICIVVTFGRGEIAISFLPIKKPMISSLM